MFTTDLSRFLDFDWREKSPPNIHLDTSFENLSSTLGVGKSGSISVDGSVVLGLDGTSLIDGLTNDVDDSAKSGGTDGDSDGSSGVVDNLSSDKSLGGVHSNGSDGVLSQMLGNFENKSVLSA
jgi:hypothetical protein